MDGLRLFNNTIYTAGKMIDPTAPYSDVDYTNTGLTITGPTSGQSIASLRTEAAICIHGIPATTTTAGAGPFDGAGFWWVTTGERVAIRGGFCINEAQCRGALDLNNLPTHAYWNDGARAVLIP